jgi:cytochrome b6-f complex iron-sulfur subunit
MATTTTARAVASTRAAAASADTQVQTQGVSRREFLYYIWGASMALLLAETGGALVWYALPQFRAGEFGGVFQIAPGTLPAVGAAPINRTDGKFWLSNTDKGLLALSAVCVHLGCLFKWSDVNHRFECPCHGSKYQADGTYIEGPAGRSLDRYIVKAITPGGANATPKDGGPVPITGATDIQIDTGNKILGKAHG